jgi:DNA-binding XRE family transcriptional regulator
MTGESLRRAQRQLGMTNAQLCRALDVAETSLCNWKAGRWPVPRAIELAVKYLMGAKA